MDNSNGLKSGEINMVGGKIEPLAYWKARAEKAESKLESLELVIVCANDIVKAWPTLTMRLLGAMTKQVDTLRQALEAAK